MGTRLRRTSTQFTGCGNVSSNQAYRFPNGVHRQHGHADVNSTDTHLAQHGSDS